MGNSSSTNVDATVPEPVVPEPEPDIDEESVAASMIQRKWKEQQTDFQWHDHLYDELLEMSEIGNVVFHLSHLFRAARKSAAGIKGLDLALNPPAKTTTTTEAAVAAETTTAAAADTSSVSASASASSSSLSKLTLAQIISIVESNQELLKKSPDFAVSTVETLKALNRIAERTSLRKVSVVGLDAEQLKKQDSSFFLIKDDKLKRITLCFSAFAFEDIKASKDWANQVKYKMVKERLPRALKAKVSGDRIVEVGLHAGFYNYLFGKVPGKVPGTTQTHFESLVAALKPILKDYPKHRLFVTGHGAAAAIGQMLAFFLTFQSDDISLPISSIGFSTPRLGDANFRRACQLMEIAGKLRTCRVTTPTDATPHYPSAKDFIHAGHQVLLDKKDGPRASYPTVENDGVPRLGRFSKKPKDFKSAEVYSTLLQANKDQLIVMNLNKLYEDIGVQSFRIKKSDSGPSVLQELPTEPTKTDDAGPLPESKPEGPVMKE